MGPSCPNSEQRRPHAGPVLPHTTPSTWLSPVPVPPGWFLQQGGALPTGCQEKGAQNQGHSPTTIPAAPSLVSPPSLCHCRQGGKGSADQWLGSVRGKFTQSAERNLSSAVCFLLSESGIHSSNSESAPLNFKISKTLRKYDWRWHSADPGRRQLRLSCCKRTSGQHVQRRQCVPVFTVSHFPGHNMATSVSNAPA